MSREISDAARAALYAPQTSEVFLDLLTIDHDDMGAPVRLVNNLTDITSRGNVYTAFPFDVQIPHDVEGELPRVDLVVDNITRLLVSAVRSIATPPTVTLEVVLASDPDTVEAGPWTFTAATVDYDARTMRFALGYEPLAQEPFPEGIYSPVLYPGLFQGVDK